MFICSPRNQIFAVVLIFLFSSNFPLFEYSQYIQIIR